MTATKRMGVVGVLAALLNMGWWVATDLPGAHAANVSATLVRTTNTSGFSPPSPDPSGITYLPGSGRLLISDGEVEEMSIYAGKNLFEVTRTGALMATGTTTAYSREPVGLSLNPSTNRLYVSDDDQMRVYTVAPGSDGRFGTSDDTRTNFSTSGGGNTDPEGVDVDTSTGELYTIDGVGAEVYRYSATGTMLAHFDVKAFGAGDPEGIAYDQARDRLFVLDQKSQAIYEVTRTGTLVNVISITAAHAVKAAGLTTAPASNGSGATNFYIVDRGVDNDVNPLENDGKLYEMAAGLPTVTNQAPSVSAGPDRTVVLPAGAALAGTATDDGLPNPPGTLTRQWSMVSGPAGATVTFTPPAAASTTATFSAAGTYSLRLTASDSLRSSSDDVTVTALPAGTRILDVAVAAGPDDAEERSTGSVTLNSGDLELTTDGSAVQTVGLRFATVGVPAGATIQRASVQFQVDEVSTGSAPLTLAAEATGNAATFTTATRNVSSRPRTTPAVPWAPADWTSVGARGLAQQTTDLASTLQQVVNLPGWNSGNAVALIVTGTGRRTAEAFEGKAPPVLHIEYREGPVVNTAPSVDAGPGQSVLLADGATLSGVVTDDGLPSPGTLTIGWSKLSGPDGDVAFADPAAASTAATFPAAGIYVLRLTAGDSALTSTDDVTITVTEPVPDSDRPTVAAATPLDGATGVAVGGNVTATFTEPMDPASLTTGTLSLVRTGDTVAVPAVVTYDGATRTVTLNPTGDLVPGTAYTATVTTGVSDVAGNTLAADHAWSFTTAAPSPGIRRETSATVVNTTATSTVAIATPAGTVAGDVLVACLALNGGAVAATGVPAGWTSLASVTSVTNPRLFGYYRVAGGSEPAAHSWRLTTAVANGAGITRYSGVNTTTPLDTAPRTAAGAAATTGTVPGLTTVTANAMVVGCMAVNSGNTGVTIGSPVGLAESWDVGGKRLELADGPQAAPGAAGDKAWTFSASREWAGWLVALRAR